MSQPTARRFRKFVHLLLTLFLMPLAPGSAQDGKAAAVAAGAVTADPAITVEALRIRLRPLTGEELAAEVDAWLALLREKIEEVGECELAMADAGDEGESMVEQEKRLIELRSEEFSLVERSSEVVKALAAKGGDVGEAEQYLAAISDLNASGDSVSRGAAVVAAFRNWFSSPEGGMLLLKRLVAALLILVFFWFVSRYAGRAVAKTLGRRRGFSKLLLNFARRTAGGLILLIGILIAVSTLGVQVGPMMAALGAGGFIIGFALQETLGSFASGLMIMIYRPFDVNDYVSVAGVEGKVEQMSLVSTTLLTLDNKVLIVPNKTVWGGTITNFTGRDMRRVDLVFGIGYGDDIPKAIEVLKEIAGSDERVLQDPEISVEVVELADSSVNIACRPWVKTADYWPVFWELTREVKMLFDREGISIPFPQRDVHMIGGE